jgi:two-component system LytT family response regulator
MNCLIIDPDKKSRVALNQQLEELVQFNVLESFPCFGDALKEMELHEADVIFFDAECLKKPDADVLHKLPRVRPHLVMTAKNKEDAIHAFNIGTDDFILKPVSQLQLAKTALRLAKRNGKPAKEQPGGTDVLFLHVNAQYIKVLLKDIFLIESQGPSVVIHTTQATHVIRGKMKNVMEQLPENKFHRIHKSFIVRLDKIQAIEEGMIEVQKRKILLRPEHMQELLAKLKLV